TYTEKRRYQPSCMVGVTCFPFGGKWVKDRTYKTETEQAVVIARSARDNAVTFTLPIDRGRSFRLDTLWLSLPQQHFIEIPLVFTDAKAVASPYLHVDTVGTLHDLSQAEPERAPFETGLGMVLGLTLQAKDQAANHKIIRYGHEAPRLAVATRQRLRHHIAWYDADQGLRPLALPESLPWAYLNAGSADDYGRVQGKYQADAGIEAIRLEGALYYGGGDVYKKQESWYRVNGQLAHVMSDPFNLDPMGGCAFLFGVHFGPNGEEHRYFIEGYDADAKDKAKVLRRQDVKAFLTAFKKQRAQDIDGKVYEVKKLAQCRQSIDDAHKVLAASKPDLERAFAAYKQAIMAAQAAR
ncbi:MAG: hypothetical protein KA214_08750, partial [Neisseriaceae bacterium]|nr:hypothetical protein [Neisseriaceae bacterium]